MEYTRYTFNSHSILGVFFSLGGLLLCDTLPICDRLDAAVQAGHTGFAAQPGCASWLSVVRWPFLPPSITESLDM